MTDVTCGPWPCDRRLPGSPYSRVRARVDWASAPAPEREGFDTLRSIREKHTKQTTLQRELPPLSVVVVVAARPKFCNKDEDDSSDQQDDDEAEHHLVGRGAAEHLADELAAPRQIAPLLS